MTEKPTGKALDVDIDPLLVFLAHFNEINSHQIASNIQ